MDAEAKILMRSAPASFCLRTKARISSGVPVFSPRPSSGSTAVRMRGPGSAPFAIASRSGTSMGEPTLCTVVKPAISVSQALDVAWVRGELRCLVSARIFAVLAETPGDVDVRVDPTGQDCEATQVVVNGRGIRIERHDLRAFDNDARVT